MKIAILNGPRDITIEDKKIDKSPLLPDQIFVETELTAFKIGTDRGNYEGAEQVPGAPDYPRGVGDSNVGIVKAIGSSVTGLKMGDRVVSRAPHQSEWIGDEKDSVVRVPDGVDSQDAVWAHLYTLSGLCFRKAFFQPGETVAVVGLGVLGLGAVALGNLFGGRVIALGNSPLRLKMAEVMGAKHSIMSDDQKLGDELNTITQGRGVDLVILAANPWPALRTAMEIVRPNGRISVVSLLGRGEEPLDFNPLAMKWFYNKGISLIAVNGDSGYFYPNTNDHSSSWNRACDHILSLMADGLLKPSRVTTHRLHYTELRLAYEMAYERKKDTLGVTFNWR